MTEINSGANKLLIVEDDPSVIKLYEAVFKNSGFEAEIKSTPDEGLEHFKKNKDTTHLVILDRDLPGMLGEVVAERMREISGRRDDPYIVMISGRAALLDINSLKQSGIDQLLAKPLSLATLLKTLTAANQRFQNPS